MADVVLGTVENSRLPSVDYKMSLAVGLNVKTFFYHVYDVENGTKDLEDIYNKNVVGMD